MARIWRWPPDSVRAACRRFSASIGKALEDRVDPARGAPRGRGSRPSRGSRARVMVGKTLRSCGTKATPSAADLARRPARRSAAPSKQHAPALGRQQAGDDLQQRRLAGAVRADDADDLAGVDARGRRPSGPRRRRRSRRRGPRRSGGSPALVPCRLPARAGRRRPRRRCPRPDAGPRPSRSTGSHSRAIMSMWCSISSTVRPSRAQRSQVLGDLARQRRVDAGDRLVEQDQLAARPSARGRSPAASSGRPTGRRRDR